MILVHSRPAEDNRQLLHYCPIVSFTRTLSPPRDKWRVHTRHLLPMNSSLITKSDSKTFRNNTGMALGQNHCLVLLQIVVTLYMWAHPIIQVLKQGHG